MCLFYLRFNDNFILFNTIFNCIFIFINGKFVYIVLFIILLMKFVLCYINNSLIILLNTHCYSIMYKYFLMID